MLEEIEQQPQALEKTLRREVKAIERFRRRIAGRSFSMVVLVARGTSDNAALFGRYLIETTVGLPTSLAAPSVTTLYGAKPNWSDALVVGLSQSGESTDTNLCLQAAREQGALTVGITNEPGSSITKCVDELFQVHAGRERSVAATKTYTGQLLVLYLLAYALGAPIPPRVLERLPAVAARALSVKKSVQALSERYRFMTNTVVVGRGLNYATAYEFSLKMMETCYVVGRGLNYATAYEFSLKMMETCYVVAERFSDADFLHGPIALVGMGFPVFVFERRRPGRPSRA